MVYDCSFLTDLTLHGEVSLGDDARTEHATDWGTDPTDGVLPDAVVWPETTDDVSAVLAAATDRGIPVTPYAAGTSVEGNAIPSRAGISLDVTRMNAVIDFRPGDLLIEVEPGILGGIVNETVDEAGLFFPPLPQSGDISTIGGMIANDASGAKTVKYGEIHDWIRALEVVLADGAVVSLGNRAKKTSSGYNLMDLLIGSEGTLGVVTKATLELAPQPRHIRGGRALFDSVSDAAAAIADVITAGVDVATTELIDPLTAEIANAYTGTDLPAVPMVFLEFHANHGIEGEIDDCRRTFERHGATRFEIAAGEEMAELWAARRELANAVGEYDPELSPLTFGDVTVPMSQYPVIVEFIRSLAAEHDLLVPTFGHAGDGNVHYTVLVDPDDPEHVAIGEDVMSQVVEKAIEMGGTATGEHGIGRGKRGFLEREHGTRGVDLMRRIKRAFDPTDTLNPGKMFPETEDGGRVRLEPIDT